MKIIPAIARLKFNPANVFVTVLGLFLFMAALAIGSHFLWNTGLPDSWTPGKGSAQAGQTASELSPADLALIDPNDPQDTTGCELTFWRWLQADEEARKSMLPEMKEAVDTIRARVLQGDDTCPYSAALMADLLGDNMGEMPSLAPDPFKEACVEYLSGLPSDELASRLHHWLEVRRTPEKAGVNDLCTWLFSGMATPNYARYLDTILQKALPLISRDGLKIVYAFDGPGSTAAAGAERTPNTGSPQSQCLSMDCSPAFQAFAPLMAARPQASPGWTKMAYACWDPTSQSLAQALSQPSPGQAPGQTEKARSADVIAVFDITCHHPFIQDRPALRFQPYDPKLLQEFNASMTQGGYLVLSDCTSVTFDMPGLKQALQKAGFKVLTADEGLLKSIIFRPGAPRYLVVAEKE